MTEQQSPATFNLDTTLAQLIERAQRIVPFDSGGITIFDPQANLLAPHTYRQSSPDAPLPHLIALGEGIIGQVAETRQPMLVNDVKVDERYVAFDSQTCAQLAVPIVANDDLLGVFSVECRNAGSYTDQHLNTLITLADYAALAITTSRQTQKQSRRYKRLTDYNSDLILRNEISHLATSDQSIDVVLPQMAERLAQLVGADACALNLWDYNEK